MVVSTCFGITLPSSGSVPSAFWEMLNWGAVDRILWVGVVCLVTWCVAIWVLRLTKCTVQGAKYPVKNLVRQRCAEGFNSGVERLIHYCAWYLRLLSEDIVACQPFGSPRIFISLLNFWKICGPLVHPSRCVVQTITKLRSCLNGRSRILWNVVWERERCGIMEEIGELQGDQKVSVHLIITKQKVTSSVKSVPSRPQGPGGR
jgi:hypothetical protein